MFRTRRVESEPLRSRSPGCPRTGHTCQQFLPWSDGHPDGGRITNMISLVSVPVDKVSLFLNRYREMEVLNVVIMCYGWYLACLDMICTMSLGANIK